MADTRTLTADDLLVFRAFASTSRAIHEGFGPKDVVRLLDHIDAQREELLGVLESLNRSHAVMRRLRKQSAECVCVFCERYRELKGQATNG